MIRKKHIMKSLVQLFLFFILAFWSIFGLSDPLFASLEIPGGNKIQNVSIQADSVNGSIGIDEARGIGNNLLSLARIVISGFALIYIVLIGVNMVISSEEEEVIAKQKKQMLYVVVGFLFLNVPGFIYNSFLGGRSGGGTLSDNAWGSFETESVFWNSLGVTGFLGDIVAFLRVTVFIVAVAMFTW